MVATRSQPVQPTGTPTPTSTPTQTTHPSQGSGRIAARFGTGPVASYGVKVLKRTDVHAVLGATGDTVIPPFVEGDGTEGGPLQYETFMTAKRGAPPPISCTPYDPGCGSQFFKSNTGFPERWPRAKHDRFDVSHHLDAYIQDVCTWASARAIRPESTMELMLQGIGDKDVQAVIRTALVGAGARIERGTDGQIDPQSVKEYCEVFYSVVMSQMRHLVPEYGEVMNKIATESVRAEESILDFYVRLINLVSLLVNAPDYKEGEFRYTAADFKFALVSALDRSAGRDLADAPDLQYKAHPRQKWAKYDLWDLVWTNYVYSKRPAPKTRHAHQAHVAKKMRRDEKREEKGSGPGERLAPRPMEVEYDANVPQWTDLSSKMREILRRYCAELRKLRRAGTAISADAKDVRRLRDQMDKQATDEGITIAVCTKCAKYGHSTHSSKCPQEA